VTLGVTPPLFRIGRRLRLVVVRNVVEHEPASLAVLEAPPLTTHALGDENPTHARRPDHPGGMELDELHVHQLGAGTEGERMTIARPFPAVAGDLEGAADTAGREHDRLGGEHVEAAAFTVVGETAGD